MDNPDPKLKVRFANNFFSRLKGLMFLDKLPNKTGLLISPCNSIHMLFMKFSIDAVFLDSKMKVVKVARGLKPWTGISSCLSACHVLELNAGDADEIFIGDDLSGVVGTA